MDDDPFCGGSVHDEISCQRPMINDFNTEEMINLGEEKESIRLFDVRSATCCNYGMR